MKFYRLSDGAIIDATQEQFNALAPAKQAAHRPYVVDQKPTPSSTQYVTDGPVVVSDTEARKTWVLADKSAEQLAAEQFAADAVTDYQQIKAVMEALRTGTGTATERLVRCERVLVRLLKDKLRERGE